METFILLFGSYSLNVPTEILSSVRDLFPV